LSGAVNDGVVDVTFLIWNTLRATTQWSVSGRIIDVRPQVPAEQALVGVRLVLKYQGTLLPQLALRAGVLCRVELPLAVAESLLDQIANDVLPSDIPPATVRVDVIRPLNEPCVRVPLSRLRELRGQEAGGEMCRRALVDAWSTDRRTGH